MKILQARSPETTREVAMFVEQGKEDVTEESELVYSCGWLRWFFQDPK